MVDDAIRISKAADVRLARGLTDAEVASVEDLYPFRFPPDLQELLRAILPVGAGFPDWRHGDQVTPREWLDEPCDGVLFDVEQMGLGKPYGERPAVMEHAKGVAAGSIAAAPRLIPIFGHRHGPRRATSRRHPVFSVHQTDIIWYSATLADLRPQRVRLEPTSEFAERLPTHSILGRLPVCRGSLTCPWPRPAGLARPLPGVRAVDRLRR